MKSLLALALVPVLALSAALPARADDNAAAVKSFRLSRILGMQVRDKDNQDLGSVHEVVFDMKGDKIAYVAVSMGGFLGFGDALHAVGWDALKLAHTQEGDVYLQLPNVARDQVKDRKGFDQNNWPKQADGAFTMAGRGANDAGNANEANDAGDLGGANAANNRQIGDKIIAPNMYKGSNLLNLQVRGKNNNVLGRVYDIIIDADSGAPSYAVVAHGGTLGIGDELTAVKKDEMQLKYDDSAAFFALNVDQKQFNDRKTFQNNNFPKYEDMDQFTSAKRAANE